MAIGLHGQIQVWDARTGALLEKIVSRYYGDLREEIYKTDTSTFKAELKKEEEVVATLLQRLAK